MASTHSFKLLMACVLIVVMMYPNNVDAVKMKGSVSGVKALGSLRFARFGYLAGGTGDIYFQMSPVGTMRYLLCTVDQYDKITSTASTKYPLCTAASSACTRNILFTNATFTRKETITQAGDFYYIIAYCSPASSSPIKITYDLVLTNPGGNQLGTGMMPLPDMYYAFIFIWCGLIALWLSNWLMYFSQKIMLHRLLTLVPVAKCASLVVAHFFYKDQETSGAPNIYLQIPSFATRLIYEAFYFLALMLVAKGWSIVRPKLRQQELYIMVWSIAFLVLALLCNGLFGGLFLFVLFIMYIIILRIVFGSVNENAHILRMQLRLIRDANIDPTSTPTYAKLMMFRIFQFSMTLYVCFILIIYAIDTIFLISIPWIGQLLIECLEVVVFIGIGFAFRLRDFSPYWERETANDEVGGAGNIQGGGVIPIPGDGPLSDDELRGDNLQPWVPGMPVPALPANAAAVASHGHAKAEPNIVVIQGPTPGSVLSAAVPVQPTYAYGNNTNSISGIQYGSPVAADAKKNDANNPTYTVTGTPDVAGSSVFGYEHELDNENGEDGNGSRK